jgi:predicted Zn-dependent protease with MMP-like domain
MSRGEQKLGENLSKISKFINPNGYAKTGRIDYHKLVRLGGLVKDFREGLLPEILQIKDVTSKTVVSKLRENNRKDLLRRYRSYRKRAESIIDEMIMEDKQITEYRQSLDNQQTSQTKSLADYTKYIKSKLRLLLTNNTGDNVDDNIDDKEMDK